MDDGVRASVAKKVDALQEVSQLQGSSYMNKDTEMTTTRVKMDTGRVIDTQRKIQNEDNMLLEA